MCDGRVIASATVGAAFFTFIRLGLLSKAAKKMQLNCIAALSTPTEHVVASESVKYAAKSDAV